MPELSPAALRLLRFAAIASTVVLLAFAALEGVLTLQAAIGHPGQTIGLDLWLYLDRTRSWLAGDGFYLPRQLAGVAYDILPGDVLYPPVVLWLLVPFTVLPPVLWWAIPLGVTAVALVRLAPAWPAWPLLALIALYPRTWEVLVYGNPSMWVIAAIAAGAAWGWPAVLALVKPTLAPLALIGVRRRGWWIGLGVLAVASLPFGVAWLDYAGVLAHATNRFGIDYVIGEWPIALGPVIARLASTTTPWRRTPQSAADRMPPQPAGRP